VGGRRSIFVLALGVVGFLLALFGAVVGIIPAIISLALVPSARREVSDPELDRQVARRRALWHLPLGMSLSVAAVLIVLLAVVVQPG